MPSTMVLDGPAVLPLVPEVQLAQAPAVLPVGNTAPGGGYNAAALRHAYGFDQITFNNGTIVGDGSGQTIAIIDAYDQPNIASDLANFDSVFGLPAPPSFRKVNQSGGTAYPASNQSWGVEISLDVEWAHAIAPGASILLVECNSSSWSDLLAGVDYARSQAGVSVVSMSWGSGEWSSESSYDHFSTPAGHQGITFVASTGDSGSSGAPEFPSISPNVLAVGGTALNVDTNGNYVSESGWSGSGGGISAYESQPSYQQGVVTQSSTMRTVPDVSYVASSSTPLGIYDTSGYGGWVAAYGTSAGAPQWAALVAIADQGRALAGQGALDGYSQTLPKLYHLPASDFHDITSGSNGGYSAGAGYDLVTGRGSPLANLIVPALIDQTTNTPPTVATPASATPTPVTGTTTNLSVLGSSPAGESTLTYTWLVTSMPAGASTPSFSSNGTNAAKNATATFFMAGTYTFQVRITDASGSNTTSSVTVTVVQTLTGVKLTPGTAAVTSGGNQQFNAAAVDQFGNAMSQQPAWSWALATGVGTVSGSGLYSAPSATTGSATIQASGGGLLGSATVTINAPVTLPNAPSNLTATQANSRQIQLKWQDNSNNETGFVIQRNVNNGGWSTLAQVGANVTSYTDGGIQKHKTYAYRVCAINSAGSSAYATSASLTPQVGSAGGVTDGQSDAMDNDASAPGRGVPLASSAESDQAAATPGFGRSVAGPETPAGMSDTSSSPMQSNSAHGDALSSNVDRGSTAAEENAGLNAQEMGPDAGHGAAASWNPLGAETAGPPAALWWLPMG